MTHTATMRIRLNGEERQVPAPLTVRALLDHLGIDGRHAAVERNRCLVKRAEHDATQLSEGDCLEVVTLVGGG